MKFDSKIVDRGGFDAAWPESFVKNEPMFFNCDLDFAYLYGGQITRNFISALPQDWQDCNPVLDSRVHMLMPGWYPCIPGWHHDDVPRSTPTGQPNYVNPEYHSEHLMGLVNGDICPTVFALGTVEVSDPDINTTIYKKWHEEVDRSLLDDVDVAFAQSGRYIQFDWQTFHTGAAATKGGWRWFARLSRNTSRQQKITNEVRRQVQVYMDNLTEGW